MKLTLLIINQIITYGTLLYGSYYVIMGVLGLIIKKEEKNIKIKNENHFAVIIPARNEEVVIGSLIDSLKKQNYPDEKLDIYVIVNNTTDNTKNIALDHGAKVLECKEEVKVKADVLNFAFNNLKKDKNIDAYIIFDADNIAHPDFLKHMNVALEKGYRVAQGFRDAKNPTDSWISGCYTIFYYIQNLFFCKSRMSIGANSTITGTGFMIKKEIIDEDGFNTYTLTEDMEFAGQCALKHEKIYYAEKAITYDEYPNDFKTSWKQRSRWTAGNLQCMKRYSFKLFSEFFKTFNISSLDMSFNYFGAFSHVIVYTNILIFRIYNLLNGYWLAPNDFISHIETYVMQILLAIIAIKLNKKEVKPLLKAVILFPIFILTWLPINIIYLFKKYNKWEEIKHNRNVTMNELKVK